MLLYFKLFAKENKAQKEDVHRALHSRMCLDFGPGFFHFFAPMDVVENKNGVVVSFGKKPMEII